MSIIPGPDPVPGDAASVDAIETMVIPRQSDIGGLLVRRALPVARRRMVGPFIFFDRMGPAVLRAGQAIDVRPHPHIGLSTVTYLFDGHIRHRDSLGNEMVIEPGDVNLMTAGRGIVHSERTPEETRGRDQSVSGLQTWLALPDGQEEIDPAYLHAAKSGLPVFDAEGASGRVILGQFAGLASPVATHADTLYVSVRLKAGARFAIPAETEERAIYTLDGDIAIAGVSFPPDRLLAFRTGDSVTVEARTDASFVLLGGAAFGSKRFIWWNFVSSSKDRLDAAKEAWRSGRFPLVPGDEAEFVPLPDY